MERKVEIRVAFNNAATDRTRFIPAVSRVEYNDATDRCRGCLMGKTGERRLQQQGADEERAGGTEEPQPAPAGRLSHVHRCSVFIHECDAGVSAVTEALPGGPPLARIHDPQVVCGVGCRR